MENTLLQHIYTMIYNKNTAKPIWKDLNIYSSPNKNKRKYVGAPNPGRDFEKSVPLYKFLIKTHEERDVRAIRKLIFEGKIRVNEVVVKELKHPLHYYDYLSIDDKTYIVIFKKEFKVHSYHRIPYVQNELVYPVLKWFLKDNFCMVNTYQNKLFKFTPTQELYKTLRDIDSVIYYDLKTKIYRLSTISEKQPYKEIVKLTGKQMYHNFFIEDRSTYDGKIKLILKKSSTTESTKTITVILPKTIFKKKYVPYFL